VSARDELANLIAQADSQEVGAMDPRTVGTMYGHLADAILAASYVKADSEEWGVSWQPEGHIEPMDSKAEASDAIDRLVFGDRVRRLVGPWEVA
jgi:hypothetical protein